MNKIIITAIGTDKPGLVNKITSIINGNNGNIDNSKMIKIEDQFAMIIEFSIPNKKNDIESKLNSIEDLKIYSKLVKDYDLIKKSTKTYLIIGSDDQGIVNTISHYFEKNNINIIEVDTFIQQAPITGSPLFNMRIVIEYNKKSIDIDKTTKDLIELSDSLNLDTKLL